MQLIGTSTMVGAGHDFADRTYWALDALSGRTLPKQLAKASDLDEVWNVDLHAIVGQSAIVIERGFDGEIREALAKVNLNTFAVDWARPHQRQVRWAQRFQTSVLSVEERAVGLWSWVVTDLGGSAEIAYGGEDSPEWGLHMPETFLVFPGHDRVAALSVSSTWNVVISGYDLTNYERQWRHTYERTDAGQPAVNLTLRQTPGAGGEFYAGYRQDESALLLRFRADGTVLSQRMDLWTTVPTQLTATFGAYHRGRLYVLGHEGAEHRLYALRADLSAIDWSYPLPEEVPYGARMLDRGVLLHGDDHLLLVDHDGALQWQTAVSSLVPGNGFGSPMGAAYGSSVLAAGRYAVALQTTEGYVRVDLRDGSVADERSLVVQPGTALLWGPRDPNLNARLRGRDVVFSGA